MNSKALCMRVVLASALSLTGGLAGAQSRNEQSAQDAAYACPLPKTAEATLQKMGELYPQKHDKNKLGCAADLMHAVATAAPDDLGLALQALLVTSEYIDHVNTLWDYDIYGVRVPEWTLRLSHAIAQGKAHDAQLARLAPDEPSVLAARSLFDVSAAYKMGEASAQLGAARLAIKRLEAATAKEPGVLDGNGLYLLGRLYYELPEYSGGDVDKGLQALARAHELVPANPSFARYYAQALDLERRARGGACGARRRCWRSSRRRPTGNSRPTSCAMRAISLPACRRRNWSSNSTARATRCCRRIRSCCTRGVLRGESARGRRSHHRQALTEAGPTAMHSCTRQDHEIDAHSRWRWG